MKAILSEKGQITIPKPIRDHLGLKAGQVLEFKARHGELVAKKKLQNDQLDKVIGILKKKSSKSVDNYITEIRGPMLK